MLTLCDQLQAIWDDPEADGPRLALADLLDPSDPLRAQFIRGQVLRGDSADVTAACFEKGGLRWLDTILRPLGFDVSRLYVQHYSPSWRACAQGHVTVGLRSEDGERVDSCNRICWQRGFVSCLSLLPAPGMELAPALTAEPIDSLDLTWNAALQAGLWSRLTVPAIAQIRQLHLSWKAAEPADFSTLYEDHWPALVDLVLLCRQDGLSPALVPPVNLAHLSRSDWPRQLRRLTVYEPEGEGIRSLRECDWKHLETLEVSSFSEQEPTGRLPWDRLPGSLRDLDLSDFNLGDDGLYLLAQAALPRLRSLRLVGAAFTGKGLAALLKAPFLEGLENLDLSRNGLSPGDLPEPWRSRVKL